MKLVQPFLLLLFMDYGELIETTNTNTGVEIPQLHTCVNAPTYTHARTHVHLLACTHAQMHAYARARASVYLKVSVHVRTHGRTDHPDTYLTGGWTAAVAEVVDPVAEDEG